MQHKISSSKNLISGIPYPNHLHPRLSKTYSKPSIFKKKYLKGFKCIHCTTIKRCILVVFLILQWYQRIYLASVWYVVVQDVGHLLGVNSKVFLYTPSITKTNLQCFPRAIVLYAILPKLNKYKCYFLIIMVIYKHTHSDSEIPTSFLI